MKLLLLEDDEELGPEIVIGLRESGFAVDHVATLADADVAISVTAYDCLILDRTVPDGDAVTLVARLRVAGVPTPILMLTARAFISDRVAGFEAGADDYLVKPFAFAELVSRIRALSRRGGITQPAVLQVAGIQLDVPRHRVQRDGIELTLTAKEFAVLEVLMGRPGEVISRSELIERCWDEASDPASNVVDVLVGQLRKRLGHPNVIEAVRGVGYRTLE